MVKDISKYLFQIFTHSPEPLINNVASELNASVLKQQEDYLVYQLLPKSNLDMKIHFGGKTKISGLDTNRTHLSVNYILVKMTKIKFNFAFKKYWCKHDLPKIKLLRMFTK